MAWEIRQGDVLQRLREMPDASVHCVVTSPPYWGLRDYGTGTWSGGDADCTHKAGELRKGLGLCKLGEKYAGGGHKIGAVPEIQHRELCPHCGATREDQQIGLEATPQEYVAKMVEVFREVKRVLRDDGTCWLNMGDSYCGNRGNTSENPGLDNKAAKGVNLATCSFRKDVGALKPKDLVGIPWRLAFALQEDGWYLRSDIIWHKPNPMPESVTDRPTKSHEYLFLLSKSERYYYDADAIKEDCAQDEFRPSFRGGAYVGNSTFDNSEGGKSTDVGNIRLEQMTRNKRTVWTIATNPFPEAHFATFPPKLVEPCILAGTSERGCRCGAPWERMVETARANKSGSGRAGNYPEGKLAGGTQVREGHDIRLGPVVETKTLGWKQSCKCEPAEEIPLMFPGVVLDPFAGAGTTGLVATRLGRNFIGIELNHEYSEMARRRITDDAPLFNQETVCTKS